MGWRRFPRVLGLVCAAYFLIMAVAFGNLSAENAEFSAGARETTGTVVALVAKPLPGGRSLRPHRDVALAPTVRFEADGQTYVYTPARGRRHPAVRVGDPVTVLYDADDPGATARIKGEGSLALPLITLGFLLTAVGLVVVLVRTRPGAPARRTPAPPTRPAPSEPKVVAD